MYKEENILKYHPVFTFFEKTVDLLVLVLGLFFKIFSDKILFLKF